MTSWLEWPRSWTTIELTTHCSPKLKMTSSVTNRSTITIQPTKSVYENSIFHDAVASHADVLWLVASRTPSHVGRSAWRGEPKPEHLRKRLWLCKVHFILIRDPWRVNKAWSSSFDPYKKEPLILIPICPRLQCLLFILPLWSLITNLWSLSLTH